MAIGNSYGSGFNKLYGIIDSDAEVFFDSASITNSSQQNALQSLVVALKSNQLWNKLDVIYPFVGGSATSHSYNLKNVNLYQINWFGAVTHNSNGVTGDGSTGYGDTNFSLASPQNDNHLSVYIRNNALNSSNKQPFGAYKTGSSDSLIGIRLIDTPSTTTTFIGSTPFSFTETNSSNYYLINRNITELTTYRNNVSLGTVSISDRDDNLLNIYLLGANFNNTSLLEPGDFNLSFFTAGSSLSSTENETLYSIIQDFQTTLGRQI